MGTSDSKPGGFTVTDRRSFASSEPAKAQEQEQEQEQERERERERAGDATPTGVRGEEPPGSLDGDEEHDAHDASVLPAVDFHTFVLSLGSSALLHLGELEHPDGGIAEKDLPLAKHTIDILSMLEEKTKGNLTSAEEKLMESLLYDLRLRYVNASK